MNASSLLPRLLRVARAVAIVLLVAAAVAWATRERWQAIEVRRVEVVEQEVIETLVTTGRVAWAATHRIAVERSGRLLELTVDAGDRVEAGELVARLEAEDAELDLRARTAARDEARARVEAFRRTARPLALGDLEAARVRREQARREEERTRELLDRGLANGMDLELARDATRLADVEVERAETALRASGRGGADLIAATAALDRAEAELERAGVALERLRVLAPADGIVLAREAEPGDVVSAGQILAVIAPDASAEVQILPDERELARLRPGQRAWVATPAVPGVRELAEVDRILPAVDAERGTIDVRLRLPNPSALLRPNLTVDVEVELRTRPAQALVPTDAVGEDAEGAWVLTLRDGRVERVAVEVGWRGDGYVALDAGPGAGEWVLERADASTIGRRARTADPVEP